MLVFLRHIWLNQLLLQVYCTCQKYVSKRCNNILAQLLGLNLGRFGLRILILIFAEALGLYGLIVGLVVASTAEGKGKGLCPSEMLDSSLQIAITFEWYKSLIDL